MPPSFGEDQKDTQAAQDTALGLWRAVGEAPEITKTLYDFGITIQPQVITTAPTRGVAVPGAGTGEDVIDQEPEVAAIVFDDGSHVAVLE